MQDPVFRLEQRFIQRWTDVGVEAQDAVRVFKTLVQAYTHPDRGYHDIYHLVDLDRELECWMAFVETEEDFRALFDSIMWHDKRMRFLLGVTDNEEQSFADFRHDTRHFGLTEAQYQRREGIMVAGTKHKGNLVDRHQQMMADMDLTNFGYPWPVVRLASRRIRHEWRHFSAEDFVAGRRKVLKMFLDRGKWLYYLPIFRHEYGERALTNIAHEIEVLPKLVKEFDGSA